MWPGGIQPETAMPDIKKEGTAVRISCKTPGASIAWQVNGKGYHKDHWFLYTGPVNLNQGDKITATAIRIGYKQSEMTELTI
jgi:hypothetical protein